MKKTITVLLSVLLMASCLLIFRGPGFLTYKDRLVPCDAVVVFLGDENRTREQEAEMLLLEGYARRLIIPALGEIRRITPDGRFMPVTKDMGAGNLLFKLRKKAFYRKYYENTHIEVLEAKRLMAESGCRSAILVSSPYHMRRIRMIAGKVFGDGSLTFNCAPIAFEKHFYTVDWRVGYGRETILSEYVKIGWFLIYNQFG